ncbi:MAG: hypothetical protein ACYTBJ_12915 [Planctomycetota bacterium]|jgi:chromosome segregation ATPase
MNIKDMWSRTKQRTSSWLREHKPAGGKYYRPPVNDEGLITHESDPPDVVEEDRAEETPGNKVVVKTFQATKKEPIEKLHEGFNQLIEQLRGINEHLSRQASQQEELMSRIEQLPKLLESFPAVVSSQEQIIGQLLEQLKGVALKNEQFMDVVQKIPTETAKQTDALVNIDHQLAAAADTDVQMAESFNKFHETLARLNQSTAGQTDSIMQMSRTFATSDRYLKYLISKQSRRFVWIFITAIGVCVLAILILAGIIIYLKQYS